MTVKRAPYAIKSKHALYTENLLRSLIDCQESERLHGIAIAGVTEDDRLVMIVAGRFAFKPKEAYWAAGKLQEKLRDIPKN